MTIRMTLAAAAVALAPAAAGAQELKWASFTPPQHTVTASVIDRFAADVAAASGGKLTVRAFHGGELGAGPVEQYVRAIQNVAEITWGLPGYTSSQFQKTMIAELPGAIPAGKSGYDAIWDAYDEYLAGEFPGTKPLAIWTSEPNIMIMRERQIRTPADLAGLKIRVAGASAAETVSALGATPVQMPITQVYNAMQTGLIDGVFTGASTLSDFKLDEVASSYTVGAPLGRNSFFAVMNLRVYEGLSPELRAVVDGASGRGLSQSAEEAWNAAAQAALAAARASGDNTVIDLGEAEIAAFAEAVSAVTAGYVAAVGGEATLAAMQSE